MACSGRSEDGVRDGINGDLEAWLARNNGRDLVQCVEHGQIAPFPPADLMQNTSGLTEQRDFAAHGVAFLRALARISPIPLGDVQAILDFGVGCGRLARLFKGFGGRYVGVDVDSRHLDWIAGHLPWVEPCLTKPRRPLPFEDGSFDVVVSISVFSHLNEADQLHYLEELARVTRSGAVMLLSIHGERALSRALAEERIARMLALSSAEFAAAARVLARGSGYHFARQDGHLTGPDYEYGMTFIAKAYLDRVWSPIVGSLELHVGALHDFQDVVLVRRP